MLGFKDIEDRLILQWCKNLRDAVKLCRDCSPLPDKAIVDEIKNRTGKKISHFSEGLDGERPFPLEVVQALEEICGNIIPTRYMALCRNLELKTKKTDIEIKAEKLEAELTTEKAKNIAITETFQKIILEIKK